MAWQDLMSFSLTGTPTRQVSSTADCDRMGTSVSFGDVAVEEYSPVGRSPRVPLQPLLSQEQQLHPMGV